MIPAQLQVQIHQTKNNNLQKFRKAKDLVLANYPK